ncbi:MAG: DNA topoisomerase I, partial [Bacteroidetes bacterium]|nr:DNA topoisomerase I [Bacteroidota bacterium]
IVQLGSTDDAEKPRFASLLKGQHLETITLNEALELFKLPRTIGTFEDNEVVVSIGKYGPYVRHGSKFCSLGKSEDPFRIQIDRAVEIILEKRENEIQKLIKSYEENKEIQILNGRWGPYISYKGKNYRIPKTKKAASLSSGDCLNIIEAAEKKKKK